MNNLKKKILPCFFLLIPIGLFGQSAIEIAKSGINATVSIVALDNLSLPLAYGSGFIIDDELVATNVHVIEGSNSVYILKNGEQKKYTVSGYISINKTNDLVILKVPGLLGNKLELGLAKVPEVGEKIYAVGNPKGLNGTFSEGIISGIREIASNQVLQITAPISPGSSGGPVLNSTGQVIGIAFASYTNGQNLNFAIPVKYLINLLEVKGNIQSISKVKLENQTKPPDKINPNIKDGVVIRHLEPQYSVGMPPPIPIYFSIKNNLPYKISDISILLISVDNTGTIVDYGEQTYFHYYNSNDYKCIEPYLAKSITDGPQLAYKNGYKIIARVLDFKIIEE